jgi:mannose-6-phosphate isomerase class I
LTIFGRKVNDNEFTYYWSLFFREHLKSQIGRINWFCDFQRNHDPLWMDFGDLCRSLHELAERPFRVKPIISSSLWGGQWLLKNIFNRYPGRNIGWSFVFLPYENSILLQNDASVEVPFDLLAMTEANSILGKEVSRRIGDDIPLRINITDTMQGDDLSCQVHPTQGFAEKEFGKKFDEYEIYYVLKSKRNSRIHLGFRNHADFSEFSQAVSRAESESLPFKTDDFINSWRSIVGQLYYVFPGSVHYIGKDNLVIEIISGSIIHTLRVYDYLRVDNQGQRRNVDVKRSLKALNPEITADFVEANLMPALTKVDQMKGCADYCFDNHLKIPIKVEIRKIERKAIIEGNGKKFHLLTLVKGDDVEIRSESGSHPLHYLETILIPAALNQYRIENQSGQKVEILQVSLADKGVI